MSDCQAARIASDAILALNPVSLQVVAIPPQLGEDAPLPPDEVWRASTYPTAEARRTVAGVDVLAPLIGRGATPDAAIVDLFEKMRTPPGVPVHISATGRFIRWQGGMWVDVNEQAGGCYRKREPKRSLGVYRVLDNGQVEYDHEEPTLQKAIDAVDAIAAMEDPDTVGAGVKASPCDGWLYVTSKHGETHLTIRDIARETGMSQEIVTAAIRLARIPALSCDDGMGKLYRRRAVDMVRDYVSAYVAAKQEDSSLSKADALLCLAAEEYEVA